MAATAEIPVIDISAPGRAEGDVARELCEAAVEHGFIYLRNGGRDVGVGMVDGVFDVSRKLFGSEVEEKERCRIQKNNRGWSGMHTETLDPKHQKIGDFKEAFNFGEFVKGKAQQPIPAAIHPYEADISSFWDSCHALCRKIVYLLGVGLKVDPPDFFKDAHLPEKGPSGTTLRFLHYPRVEGDTSERIRAGAHSDYGSVTLLFRLKGQPGLQVLSKSDTWLPVPVHPPGTESDPAPPILVNIGDLLSYWTNGLLRSTVHRVIFPTAKDNNSNSNMDGIESETDAGDRYSIAFFCHPAGTTPLEAVPSEVVRNYVPESKQEGAGRGKREEVNPYLERRVLTADEHLQMRLRASYLSLYRDDED